MTTTTYVFNTDGVDDVGELNVEIKSHWGAMRPYLVKMTYLRQGGLRSPIYPDDLERLTPLLNGGDRDRSYLNMKYIEKHGMEVSQTQLVRLMTELRDAYGAELDRRGPDVVPAADGSSVPDLDEAADELDYDEDYQPPPAPMPVPAVPKPAETPAPSPQRRLTIKNRGVASVLEDMAKKIAKLKR
jgi:hypothetical protein